MTANAAGQAQNSVLGNLASVDINIKIQALSALYLFLVVALGATSFFLAKKYI